MSGHTSTASGGTRRAARDERADGNRDADGDSGSPRRAVTDPESSVVGRRQSRFDRFDDEPERDTSSNLVVWTLKFVYRHSAALVPAGVLWAVLSLPLITVGPASLGMYATVESLRETGRVDRAAVVRTVRENLVPATLLGFLPPTFFGIALLYVGSGLASGLVGSALTAVALYAGLYVGVMLIPTFVGMARGVEPRRAVREAYVWLAGAPVSGLQLLLVTAAVLVATLGLTIGFVLLFAGITATYHVAFVDREASEDGPLSGVATGTVTDR